MISSCAWMLIGYKMKFYANKYSFQVILIFPYLNSEMLEQPLHSSNHITKTRLFKYKKISLPKTENFQVKNSDIFHISAQT